MTKDVSPLLRRPESILPEIVAEAERLPQGHAGSRSGLLSLVVPGRHRHHRCIPGRVQHSQELVHRLHQVPHI